MFARSLVLIAVLMAWPQSATACKFMPRPLEEAAKAAEVAFVGTVRTVENGLAIIHAEKGIKGIEKGQEIDVEIGGSSCAVRFQAGQRWLYLGATQQSGSLLLRDEFGRENAENIRVVNERFGGAASGDGDIIGGTAEDSCAPWGSGAFSITLDNGISATVFATLEDIAKKAGSAVVSFSLDGKQERNKGMILRCPVMEEGETGNIPCQSMTGSVSIGQADENSLSGQIETDEGEHHSRYVFKARRVSSDIRCR